MKLKLTHLLVLAALPAAAYADDSLSPWYVGAGAGQTNFGPNCEMTKMQICGDDEPFAYEAFGGYMINDYLSLELGWRHLGHSTWIDYDNVANDVGVKGFTLGVVGYWPLGNNWKLVGEAGAFNYTTQNEINWGTDRLNHSDVGPYLGAGISYDITKKLALAAKYRRYEDIDESRVSNIEMDANYWGITLSYRFGGSEPEPTPEPVVVAAAPVDSDNDGVTDDIDQCPNTPMDHKVDAQGCTIYTDKLDDLKIEAQFDNNSTVLKPESMGEIEKAAKFLNKYPKAQVEIAGHASLPGKEDYNMWISQKRADAVAKVLVEQYGIDANRITSKGYGETEPLMQGSSAEANAVNRRIVAKAVFKEKQPLLK